MKKEDEIVVFQTFDTSIDANIIKAKLDAYDIECFLTDENLSNLYPGVGTHVGAFRVKLYVFAKDIEEATRILEKNHLQIDDDSITRCPKCGSKRFERDFPKKVTNTVLSALMMALFAVFFPERKVHHCLDCETEFN
jgi:DNA-directed RNA polymerase subunit RPC12/RpoP